LEWDVNGPGAAAFFGLSQSQVAANRPALTHGNEMALAVWNFCGGWKPEALPLAVAYFAIDDPDALIESLITIRDELDKREQARREAQAR
jgi:hypothetical protein